MNGVDPTRAGNADQVFEPHGVFPCTGEDEWVAIACETDAQRAALSDVIGATNDAAIEAWTSSRSPGEVEVALQAVGVPVHGVQNSAACWQDPQLLHRGHYLTVEHPIHRQCVVEGARVVLSRTPAVVRRANPRMGEHNDHVLRDLLAYDEDHITALVIAGALG
jgi:crotonobetainyl-CoA:carnitine CoA-transferase CaiB-like acyl-CoA transferase